MERATPIHLCILLRKFKILVRCSTILGTPTELEGIMSLEEHRVPVSELLADVLNLETWSLRKLCLYKDLILIMKESANLKFLHLVQ